MGKPVILISLIIFQGCVVSSFFLAGGWESQDNTDQCVVETAKNSVLQLFSSTLFQSELDSNRTDCVMELKELKTAEKQLVAGTNWKFRTINEFSCKDASLKDEPRDVRTT